MPQRNGDVGGQVKDSGLAEAKSALAWWLEAGVDVAIAETPRDWLASPRAKDAVAPVSPEPNVRIPEPETLEALKTWLATGTDVPLAGSNARPALPHGPEEAEVMLFCEAPASDMNPSGQPIAGEAWGLAVQMLAAIGFTADQAYSASLACFHVPGKRMTAAERELCAEIARRHIRLARPKRLLLFGEGPCFALLGKSLPQARGHIHKVEGVRAVATFHPRNLIHRTLDKARAWEDLLLLMENEA